jgi:hypothetical protein
MRWNDSSSPEPVHQYTEFLTTKRGLATALHSGDPAFYALPGYFMQRLGPALGSLLEAATVTGEIRAVGLTYSQRMVAVLIDGLCCGAELQRS